MRYYVEINGESSLDIQGLMIQSLPSISKPLMRSKQETIDGRDGDIVTKLGYSAYDKTLKIGLWGNYDINEVIAFFNQEGTITFSNEPDKYYRFTILNRDDYVSQLDKFRTCTIALHCQPYKYKLNEEAEELENEYVEQEGTSLSFNNSLVAPMNIDLKGNTLQNGTPTPSSPIPINNVSGDNQVNVCGKNLFDKDTMVLNAFINQSNLQLASSNDFRTIYIPCKPNTTYTIQKIQSNRFVWGFTSDDNLTIPKILSGVGGENTKIQKTITSTNDAKYMFVMVSKITDDTTNINDLLNSIQIEEGTTATTYEAYNGTTYNIDLPVENLFDKDTMVYGEIYYLPADTTNTQLRQMAGGGGVLITKLQEGATYTISKRAGARFRAGFTTTATPQANTNNVITSRTPNNDNGTSITFVVPNGSPYFVCNYFSIDQTLDAEIGYTNMLNSIQLEQGNKANTYTPYGTTPIELNKIGTYQDKPFKAVNGDKFYDSLDNATKQTLTYDKWYLHKEIGKVVLNGSEAGWNYQSRGNNVYRGYITISNGSTSTAREIALSNYFYAKGGLDESSGNIFINSSQVFLYTNITTIDDFKTWLSTHNTIVNYILATSTNTEITYTPLIEQLESIKNAMSKEGTTNVNQVNNDAPFIINASVLSGTDSITLTNEGNATSKPTITITGSGVVGVYLENIQMFNISLGTNETIIIDTENMEAYYGSQLKNRQVTGDYSNFALQSGTNNLKFTGLVTNVEITNYNRWI